MPAFLFNTPENTYKQTVTGGTVGTDVSKDVVVSWMAALEQRKTPILDKIMSNEEFDQELHQWGQSYKIPTIAKLSATATNVVGTITLNAGEARRFQINNVIEVYTPKVGTDIPDPATYEQMIVTAINTTTDVLTVSRGSGTTAYAHAIDDVVRIIGTVNPQNSDFTFAPNIRGMRFFNYPQRFQAAKRADKRAQNQSTWEHPNGNAFLQDFASEAERQKFLLEESVFKGKRVAPTDAVNGVSRFGGIDHFLTTNDVGLSGAKLTADTLDNTLANLWLESDDISKLTIVCSMTTARILDMTIDPAKRTENRGDGTYDKTLPTYHFRTGTFTVEPTRHVPDGMVYILDWNNIKLRPFKGLNWHISGKDGATHAADHDVKAISGDFTLQVDAEHMMAKVSGFEGRLNQYP